MSRILLAFGFIVIYKFLINTYRYFRISKLQKMYVQWLTDDDSGPNIVECKKEVIDLWKDSGIVDGKLSITEPAGFGLVKTGNVGMFRNFPSSRSDMTPAFLRLFSEAKGEFRRRIKQSVNPLWWLDFAFRLPTHIVSYFGFSSNSISFKISQLIYWLFGVVVTGLTSLYPSEMRNLIERFFK